MIVDRTLIDAAAQALRQQFPAGPGAACAVYSREGRIIAGARDADPEALPIAEAAANGELIGASVTVAWDGPGSRVRARTPSGESLGRLQEQARRHAQVATGGFVDGEVTVRPMWELIPEIVAHRHNNQALERGRYGGGMKAIGAELVGLAREPGVRRARAELQGYLLDALRSPELRRIAASRSLPGPRYPMPMVVDSLAIRHVWAAFELASERFTFDVIDSVRPQIEGLGCNAADVTHIKQGLEALRNIFGVMLWVVATREEAPHESPFNPYSSGDLTVGVPIHRYLALGPLPTGEPAARDRALIGQLIELLANKKEGGFTSYLRQRELFKVDLFAGGGVGHCPFSVMSNEIVYETAAGLRRALEDGLILVGTP